MRDEMTSALNIHKWPSQASSVAALPVTQEQSEAKNRPAPWS